MRIECPRPPSDPVAPNGMCSLTRNCAPAAGDIVFERSRAEKVRVPPPITVHHAAPCEANRPSTTVNLNVTMRGDLAIAGALVMETGSKFGRRNPKPDPAPVLASLVSTCSAARAHVLSVHVAGSFA